MFPVIRGVLRVCISHTKIHRISLSSEKIWTPFDGGARVFDANEYLGFGQLLYRHIFVPYCAWTENQVGALISLVIDALRLAGLQ